jgi:hypothetical protein
VHGAGRGEGAVVRALALAGIVFAIAIPAVVLWRFSVQDDTPPPPPPHTSVHGTMAVTSTPNGADIAIDGVHIARTPWTGEVSLGKHEVDLTADGYQAWHQRIDVTASALAEVRAELAK